MGSREKKYGAHAQFDVVCLWGEHLLPPRKQPDRTSVVVPEVLRPFMGGVDFMPFIRTMDGKRSRLPKLLGTRKRRRAPRKVTK